LGITIWSTERTASQFYLTLDLVAHLNKRVDFEADLAQSGNFRVILEMKASVSNKIGTFVAVNGFGREHKLPACFSLDADRNAISFVDSKADESFKFAFDKIIKGKGGLDHSYSTVVGDLVTQTAAGASTMCVLCGSPSLATEFLLPSKGGFRTPGSSVYLKSVAADLIKAVPASGCVTFSWFNVATQTGEQITDVLRAASNPKSTNTESSLILREIARGRGMTVPGLTQVELGAAADVEAVIKHVQQVLTPYPTPNPNPNPYPNPNPNPNVNPSTGVAWGVPHGQMPLGVAIHL